MSLTRSLMPRLPQSLWGPRVPVPKMKPNLFHRGPTIYPTFANAATQSHREEPKAQQSKSDRQNFPINFVSK